MAHFVITLLSIIVPPIWWRKTTRESTCFSSWVGLKEVKMKAKRSFWFSICIASAYIFLAATAHAFIFPGMLHRSPFDSVFMNVAPLAFQCISTEYFFRGFIGKRLIGKLGFAVGNTIQAAIYGVFHVVVLTGFMIMDMNDLIVYFLMLASFGWATGYIMEKQAGGSIVPACIMYSAVMIASIILIYFFG